MSNVLPCSGGWRHRAAEIRDDALYQCQPKAGSGARLGAS
jgi:hypothetical protein